MQWPRPVRKLTKTSFVAVQCRTGPALRTASALHACIHPYIRIIYPDAAFRHLAHILLLCNIYSNKLAHIMDNVEHINFNAFPFKLRFSKANKIYQEFQSINERLNNVLVKLNVELREKMDIANILSMFFSHAHVVE